MRPAHKTSRKAFTIIELLVVVGVIAVLAALVTYGMGKFIGAGKERETAVLLKNLQGMLTALDNATKLEGVDHKKYAGDPGDPKISPPQNLSFENTRNTHEYFRETRRMMLRLRQLSENKKGFENLPPTRLLLLDPIKTNEPLPSPNPNLNTIPLVLDAWDNPIIYVPAGGVPDIEADKTINHPGGAVNKGTRVRHGGFFYTALKRTTSSPPSGDWFKGIQSPTGQPFFVSAGRDGNLEDGDDNLYSFEQ